MLSRYITDKIITIRIILSDNIKDLCSEKESKLPINTFAQTQKK